MQRFDRGLVLLLAFALVPSSFAFADEALYQTGQYFEGGCDAGGCDASCGGCGEACCMDSCCCSGCCGWYAGAEAFFAQPRIKDNNAYSLFGNVPGAQVPTFNTLTVPYEYDYDVTPRIWIGYMDCCGTGFRGGWWRYDDDSDLVSVTVPSGADLNGRTTRAFAGEMFSASQRLELELVELELTNAFDLCGGCALVSYGVRYVRYESQTLEQVGSVDSVFEQGSVVDAFDGFGPTLALEFNRPVNCRWSVYGKLRGTIALGDRDTSATSALFGEGDQRNMTTRSGEEAFAIAELQIGVQWNYCCWFVRGGWQAQYWDDAMEVAPLIERQEFDTLGDIGVHGFNIAVGYAR